MYKIKPVLKLRVQSFNDIFFCVRKTICTFFNNEYSNKNNLKQLYQIQILKIQYLKLPEATEPVLWQSY